MMNGLDQLLTLIGHQLDSRSGVDQFQTHHVFLLRVGLGKSNTSGRVAIVNDKHKQLRCYCMRIARPNLEYLQENDSCLSLKQSRSEKCTSRFVHFSTRIDPRMTPVGSGLLCYLIKENRPSDHPPPATRGSWYITSARFCTLLKEVGNNSEDKNEQTNRSNQDTHSRQNT